MVEPREHAHEVATALPHRDLRVLQPGVGQKDKLVDVRVLGHVDQSAERQVRLEDRESERVLLGAGWGATRRIQGYPDKLVWVRGSSLSGYP